MQWDEFTRMWDFWSTTFDGGQSPNLKIISKIKEKIRFKET